jgi:uncharacterized protein (TIGR00369 family)
MKAKRVPESRIILNQLMLPQHANPMGTVHGGVIMKLADETGGLCAMRHSQRPVVTVAIDSMTFHSPVQVGDLVSLKAGLNWVGRSSMEVEVRVIAENPLTGHTIDTHSAYFVYVALGDDGRPVEVPQLILETEGERQRWSEGEARQQRRLAAERVRRAHL